MIKSQNLYHIKESTGKPIKAVLSEEWLEPLEHRGFDWERVLFHLGNSDDIEHLILCTGGGEFFFVFCDRVVTNNGLERAVSFISFDNREATLQFFHLMMSLTHREILAQQVLE